MKFFRLVFVFSLFVLVVSAQKPQLFLVAAQSNAVGQGDSTKSVACLYGTSFEYQAVTDKCVPLILSL